LKLGKEAGFKRRAYQKEMDQNGQNGGRRGQKRGRDDEVRLRKAKQGEEPPKKRQVSV